MSEHVLVQLPDVYCKRWIQPDSVSQIRSSRGMFGENNFETSEWLWNGKTNMNFVKVDRNAFLSKTPS